MKAWPQNGQPSQRKKSAPWLSRSRRTLKRRSLHGQGVAEVKSGTHEAGLSGSALKEILEQVVSYNVQVSQIASAADQQTVTTKDISENIVQVTRVVKDAALGLQELDRCGEPVGQPRRGATGPGGPIQGHLGRQDIVRLRMYHSTWLPERNRDGCFTQTR